jgi:KDO2-lipid IV(A) lauroyltransferase
MSESISYLAYLLGWKIVALLPERSAYSLFSKIALRMLKRNGKSVRRLRVNLSIVQPHLDSIQLEDLVERALKSYMRYWCDTFRIHKWSANRIESSVTTTNGNLLTSPMSEGKGVIIALPHSGNWDHAGAYFCQQGIPLVTVAEVLKPIKLFEKFLQYREAMGFEVLALDSKAFPTLMRRTLEKRLIALVSDRDLSSSGIPVTFFSRQTRMPAGPALLAIKTGVSLVAAHVSYTDTGIHIDFETIEVAQEGDEQSRISATVQAMAQLFEAGIAKHPHDWHMLQRIWLDEGIY